MLLTLFVILLVLWFLGLVTSFLVGGFIHILLVLALLALAFEMITTRRSALAIYRDFRSHGFRNPLWRRRA
ncbi:MAG TPA: lmo0937 family membrane protein [Burkholderiales bacterium]|nr:lmo0937 family membrane protein [Burkholderiales bacterium]